MADVALLRTVWDGVAGAPYYTTLAVDASDPGNIDQVRDAWEDFLQDQASNIDTRIAANIQGDVPVVDLATGTLVRVETITPAIIDMNGLGDILPASTQGLCRLRTGLVVGGRRLRGRLFLPGMTEANSTAAGVPSSALQSDVDAALTLLITASAGAWVVYSRTHQAISSVTTASLWSQWAVLRSRRD